METSILTTIIQGGSFAALIYFGWYVISGYRKQNDDFLARMDKSNLEHQRQIAELHTVYQKRLEDKSHEQSKNLEAVTSSLEGVKQSLENLKLEVTVISKSR